MTAYLAPIFDFVPSPSNIAALPIVRHGTPDRGGQKPANAMQGYDPTLMSGSRTAVLPGSGVNGRMVSSFSHGSMPRQPPPQFMDGDGQLIGIPPHPSAMAYHGQPSVYYQTGPPPQQFSTHEKRRFDGAGVMDMLHSSSADMSSLGPAATISGMGLPASHQNVYIDQYGHPHPVIRAQYATNGDMLPPPVKRQKSEDEHILPVNDDQQGIQEEEVEEDDESIDEIRDAPPLPSTMRLSNKPLRPKPSASSSRTRSKLLSLFSMDEPIDVRTVFGITTDVPLEFDIDTIIDSQGHTALHWACALAKIPLIVQLINLGADIFRGNYAGETPLIRSVLTTNHAEAGTFGELLDHLAPSARTLDHAYRTVIHHIALIAGVKGRASSARAYMTGVLEWVAKEQRLSSVAPGPTANGTTRPSLGLKHLVDMQDVHGDTALNVAARVGNKGLVRLLLDADADKARANKLGLKPQDFGVEVEVICTPLLQCVLEVDQFSDRHYEFRPLKQSFRI